MDKLDKIFELQQKFDSNLIQLRNLQEITPDEWIRKEVLAMIAELSELLEEVNFKWWKNPHPLNREAIKEELVDILHFYISMCLKMDLTAEEIFEAYKDKNKENFRRQEGKSQKKGYEVREK